MSETFKERRLSARIKGRFEFTIKDQKEEIIVSTIDLSASGLHFKSDKNIPLFREIDLLLTLPKEGDKKNNHFTCNAIVVRNEKCHFGEGHNIALTFVDIDDNDKEDLLTFLKKAQELQSNPIK